MNHATSLKYEPRVSGITERMPAARCSRFIIVSGRSLYVDPARNSAMVIAAVAEPRVTRPAS